MLVTDNFMPDSASWCVPSYDCPLWLGRRYPWCIVIPVINEGERISTLVDRMSHLGLAGIADIIIIDGGSSDGSVQAKSLEARGVRGLLVKTGSGRLSAQLRCAYSFALEQGYQGIVTIDGNNKDDPAAIPTFIAALEEGVDFVQASRFVPGGQAENTPKLREIAIRWIHAPLLSFFSGQKWTDTTQGFRAYRSRVLLDVSVSPFRDIFQSYELLAYLSYRVPRLGYLCRELPASRRYPSDGFVPTKISGVRGNLNILGVLFKACLGLYDPPAS